MNFEKVAQTFETIEKTSSRLGMTQQLAELLQEATAQEAEKIAYLALGVLNAPHIGTQFSIAQKSMLKIIAHFLMRTETEIQEQLVQFGDLGSVVQHVLPEKATQLTIEQVYQKLKSIEAISGSGSQERKSQLIQELLKVVDPISAKYIVRIILGTLRLGFSDMTLIDALSWMEVGNKSVRDVIEDAYNVCADPGLIVKKLKLEGLDALKSMKMQVGVPVRPAAADRLPDVQAIVDKLGPCIAQPKLDGFRLQVHVDLTQQEPQIHFYSRNLTDMSAMFPEFVAACKQFSVKTLIADGEAMVYDPNTKQFASFQETVKRRRKHGIEQMASELPLQLYLFDILYLDGNNLLDATHTHRRELLEKILANNHDETLQIIDEKKINTAQELETYFIESIAQGLEGLVVKKPDAPYQPGKRSSNWIKLKYQASEKLNDTLDVVILGYYPGRGKRAQFGIGAFLVGIYNPRNQSYETIAKIGTGLTDLEWVELKQRCDNLAVLQQPKDVICDKQLFPAVWTAPVQVCEVLADEITLSPIHTAGKTATHLGYALRFPRFVQYRNDKSSHQATTLAELESLHAR